MKRLSDYKGEEAIELWADLLDPVTKILANKEVSNAAKAGKPILVIAKEMLKTNAKEVTEILLRIDDTPLTGLSIPARLISMLNEMQESEELRGFFNSAEQEKTAEESSGSATENTEADEK